MGSRCAVSKTAVTDPAVLPEPSGASSPAWKLWIGLSLNMLEPPAIIVAIALALSRASIPLDAMDAWVAFLVWIVPAMLIAAGGEALWLGTRN